MKGWFVTLLLAGVGLLSVGSATDQLLPAAASADATPDVVINDPWAPDNLDDAIVPSAIEIEPAPVDSHTALPAQSTAEVPPLLLQPPARAPPIRGRS